MAHDGGVVAARPAGTVREHLAEHFENPTQQFEAGNLGMWLFLATEVLLFGGLFCVYVILRAQHPEIFRWGHHFLDVRWGTLNTLVLLTSSLTVAWAMNCARRGRNGRLVLALAVTFLLGCAFLGVKYVEYSAKVRHGLLWGTRFHPDPAYVAAHFGLPAPAGAEKKEAAKGPDPVRGKKLFLNTCASCHGQHAQGLPGQGKNLRVSRFVAGKSDAELLAFIKIGRPTWDPMNTTKVDMPPRGGNPMLKDNDLQDIIAFIRVVQKEAKKEGAAAPAAGAAAKAKTPAAPALEIPRSAIAPAPAGPPGLRPAAAEAGAAARAQPPPRAHFFFGLYFLMTGLHGLHLLAGLVVVGVLFVLALRRRFGPGYFAPVQLGGLYWHLVDLIWLFLFPLFYLIA